MQSRPTRVVRWKVKCKEEEHQTITYALAGDTHGRLLGMTRHRELAEFNYWEDPVYEEVIALVRELLARSQGTGGCFGRIVGVVCDPAPSGDLYDFTGNVWCPICGSSNVAYGPDEPPQFEVIDLPLVTHTNWHQLSGSEKRKRIRQALEKAGCLP